MNILNSAVLPIEHDLIDGAIVETHDPAREAWRSKALDNGREVLSAIFYVLSTGGRCKVQGVTKGFFRRRALARLSKLWNWARWSRE